MEAESTLFAAMIANFDSTAQRAEWETVFSACATKSDTASSLSLFKLDEMWASNGAVRRYEKMLGEYSEFAKHFAGIIRTAYLYCPRILLPYSQLFDGVFFLALGPNAVNGILGKSYTDSPSIVASGRTPTMEEMLEQFTLQGWRKMPRESSLLSRGNTRGTLTPITLLFVHSIIQRSACMLRRICLYTI